MMTTGRTEASSQKHHPTQSDNLGTTDDNPLGLPELSVPTRAQPWRWIGLFTFVLISMSMLATMAVVTIAGDKRNSLLKAEKNRLQESVLGRVGILETWLNGQRALGKRLTNSHVFRLFVTDLATQDLSLPLPRPIQDQRPYFHQLIADFADQNDLVRATVLRGDGATLLSSSGPKLDIASLLDKANDPSIGRRILYSSIRTIGQEPSQVVIDAMMAVPRAQERDDVEEAPPAYLVLTLDASPIIQTALTKKVSAPTGEEIALFQRRGEVVDKFRMTPSGVEVIESTMLNDIVPGMPIAFARRGDDPPVYSVGEGVDGVQWTLYQALNATIALEPLHQFVGVAASVAALTVLLLTVAFSSLWWRHDRNYHARLVDIYKGHADKVDRQRQFLKAVTRSIGDWLTVTSSDGKIIYANPSFNAAIGRLESSENRPVWHELIKPLPSNPVHQHDMASLVVGSSFERIEIGNSQYTVSKNATDFRTDDGDLQGTVHIIRDYSDFVKERQRRLGSLSQTVNAFIRAVERRDPFLLGHTKRVRAHALAVGSRLELSQEDLATLALSASLSQVGKIFIPKEILTKPDRHDTLEEDLMREHILHAIEILEPIEFDLPVARTLAQMYERLDGSGYPYQLLGEQIDEKARILAVADVFCARTAPRSYREQLSAGKALFHLASNDQRYDLKVVSALADVVGNNQGIGDFEISDHAFIDSEFWQNRFEAEAIRQQA